ncbi:uncharacterized protein PV09_01366 [Verruconis gallopava]|uniref:Zn(2)-C6 fungal-type domain-containing protein n=1 Tax=Verruconis gallopava TaxID=253628 RepID=A0A0D2AP61_9PEZI|nr:uncharacterized protein PV09_01366 [Verruconis gallopava]KIW08463.1 hypothetical protein PV09_01366 [Verruconis gallopava]
MSAFTTVNPVAPPAAPAVAAPPPPQEQQQNGQPSHSPVSHPEPEPEPMDDESVLSDVPPDTENMPLPMSATNYDGATEPHDQEPNPKKRKRYNDPPNEVHAELRRPQLPGQWYSKTPEQWEELSHLHKLIYSHVGRIEETDLGEEVEPCEACRKRGFKCMKYKQDHPEVEKLYKGNVRVGTSCTRCRRYRRTCALPGKKQNGTATTPSRPQSLTNGYNPPPSATSGEYKTQTVSGADGLDTWENTLLAAASGGSPLTSVASSPAEYNDPPTSLPPTANFQANQNNPSGRENAQSNNVDHDDSNQTVTKNTLLNRIKYLEFEIQELRASQSDFNKERDWNDQKRDLQAEIYRLREDQRKTREENWALQNKVIQLEKDFMAVRGADIERIMAEAELKVENRQLTARVQALTEQRRAGKAKVKELKKTNRRLRRRNAELEHGNATSDQSSGAAMPPRMDRRHSDLA